MPLFSSLLDQSGERCPFLSLATTEQRLCIKAESSKGICTISTLANNKRQEWLVCPYRAVNNEIILSAVRTLFSTPPKSTPYTCPSINLTKSEVRDDILFRLNEKQQVFVCFDAKMGGELSIPATSKSPEFAFDVTIIEIKLIDSAPHVGRFGILEIQTMDFHGSYRAAVRNLRDGLRLHPRSFGKTLQNNQQWLAEGIEGPNIANVFKRTFYQMMFKFQLGKHERCAGCVLAIPESVWDSWQKHLGEPSLVLEKDGTYSLFAPGRNRPASPPACIYVFNPDATSKITPSPIDLIRIIATDVPALSHWALEVAPAAALSNIDSSAGMLSLLGRRLKTLWPDLSRTLVLK